MEDVASVKWPLLLYLCLEIYDLEKFCMNFEMVKMINEFIILMYIQSNSLNEN